MTRQHAWNLGVTWARDGLSIVYAANPGPRLWRVPADGSAPPERLELAGRGATGPSAAGGRDRLAFSRRPWDADIYRLQPGGSPAPLLQSTYPEFSAQFSPDGRRIAFYSERADDAGAVWLADADGSNPTRLTRGPGRGQSDPCWSPDGRSLAFGATAEDGGSDVWTIGADGSGLRQVTHHPDDEARPFWSRDGRFIYFVSNRTGRSEIWRIAVADGSEVQLTTDGGVDPLQSLDGRTLYSVRPSDNALVARPSAGGTARTILACVDSYAVLDRGLLYFECVSGQGPSNPRRILRRWDAASGQDRPVASIDAPYVIGLGVSPDGQTVLYGHSSWGIADLMMIENFR